MKINIIGNIFGKSGYDIHTRSLANGLHQVGCDVRIDSSKPQQWERECNDAEFKMCTKEFDPDCVSIMIATPPNWRFALAEKPKKFYGFCVWEGDTIPEYWIEYLTDPRIDKILVPSEHTRKAILNTFIRDTPFETTNGKTYGYELRHKIIIIPHGVDLKKFYPKDNNKERPFTFIANKGWAKGLSDRGGIQWLLKAFDEEFTEKDNCILKVKINPVYNNPSWNLNDEINKLNLNRDNKAKIFINPSLMTDAELLDFYNGGDVFVSTSMADGFNLPVIEAMACEMPVLVTKFGGQEDFVNDKYGWFIDQGTYDYYASELIYEDVKWFKPDLSQIKNLLRLIYNQDKESLREKGFEARKEAEKWTWTATAKKLKKEIENEN